MSADDGGSPPSPPAPPPVPEIARPGALMRLRSYLVDLTPLRTSRQFRLLWMGQSVSDIGTLGITWVAIPFQVYALTRSPFAVGLVALFELVPVLALGLVGGAIADAVDRRKLLLWANLGQAAAAALLALNARPSLDHLWVVYVLASVQAALSAVARPAFDSTIPRLVPKELLPSAIATYVVAGTFGFLVGPLLGGSIIAAFGLAVAYLVDAGTFVWALAFVAAMAPVPPHHESGPPSLRSIREGLRFAAGHRVLLGTFLADLVGQIGGMPQALFPAVALRLGGGPRTLGLLFSAGATGSFLVNLFGGRGKHVRRQGAVILVATAVWGAGIVGFGLATTLWLALVCLAVASGADMLSGIFRMAIPAAVVPDRLRGRVSGIGLIVVDVGPALGNLEAGAVGSLVGVPFSIVSGGLACIAGAAILAAALPAFTLYDASKPAQPGEGTAPSP
ncbi:MAG: MFS transporter [Actinomycetota bacterium]|nr:MFS transporter [Actinomycetota bacterium]